MTWALPPSPGGRGGCGRWRFSKHLAPHEELSVPTSPHVRVTSGDAVPERTPSRFSSLILQRNPPRPSHGAWTAFRLLWHSTPVAEGSPHTNRSEEGLHKKIHKN